MIDPTLGPGWGRAEFEDLCALVGRPLPAGHPYGGADREEYLGRWLTREMLATPAARERAKTWAHVEDTPEARRTIARSIARVSDPHLDVLLDQALERIPAPVLSHLQANTMILTLGATVRGWCATPRIRATATESLQVLVVNHNGDDDDFVATAAHEVGHSWTVPRLPLDAPPVTDEQVREADEQQQGRLAFGYSLGLNLLRVLVTPEIRLEEVAGDLARAWGFTGPAADGDRCARARLLSAEVEGRRALAAVGP